jgi:D-alanine-D-alanine ligase
MAAPLRVAVVFGGLSAEHEVSCVSARSVMRAMDRKRFEPVPFAVSKRGGWLNVDESLALVAELDAGRTRGLYEGELSLTRRPDAMAQLMACDVAFPLVHGTNGEDGTLQGLFEIGGMPYVGAGVAGSAVGMDKALMKGLLVGAGLPVVRYEVLRAREVCGNQDAAALALRRLEARLPYPWFVKPANGGSSVGISMVRSREDAATAMRAAFEFDTKILVEESGAGRELEVAVLGNDLPEASGVGEIVPDREFYDYDSKYDPESQTELRIPAPLEAEAAEAVREMALQAYRALDLAGMARVDFFYRADGTIYLNEVNTIPGFTSISMYPKLWEHAGLSYTELVSRLIDLGLERWQERHGG